MTPHPRKIQERERKEQTARTISRKKDESVYLETLFLIYEKYDFSPIQYNRSNIQQ